MARKVKLKVSPRLLKKRTRRSGFAGSKHCRFCVNKDYAIGLDYKNAIFLKAFLTERGKILPSRISGNCCKHQRVLSRMIRCSRTMALLPYTAPMY